MSLILCKRQGARRSLDDQFLQAGLMQLSSITCYLGEAVP